MATPMGIVQSLNLLFTLPTISYYLPLPITPSGFGTFALAVFGARSVAMKNRSSLVAGTMTANAS
jgi:hypothetical protein